MGRRRTIIRLSPLLLLITLGILTALYLYLPTYLETYFIPHFTKGLGIDHFTCDVRRVGYTGADLGSVMMGSKENNSLSISSVQIDYSPWGLSTTYIEKILLSGIEFYCELTNGKLTIPGLDMQTFLSRPPRTVRFGRLVIRNAVIACNYKGHHINVPLTAEITPHTSSSTSFDGRISLYPGNQKITLTFNLDLVKKTIFTNFEVPAFHLEKISTVTSLPSGFTTSGIINLAGTAALQYEPFTLLSIFATCKLLDPHIGYKDIVIQNARNAEVNGHPLRIELTGEGTSWNLSSSTFSLVSPLPLGIDGLTCSLRMVDNALKATGHFTTILEPLQAQLPIPLEVRSPLFSKGTFSASFAGNGAWAFTLSSTPVDTLLPHHQWIGTVGKVEVSTSPPHYTVSASGKNGKGIAQVSVTIPHTRITTPQAKATLPSTILTGTISFDNTTPSTLKGEAVAKLFDAQITEHTTQVKASGIHVVIPLSWPQPHTPAQGTLSIASLQWRNILLGTVKGVTTHNVSGIAFEGAYNSSLLPDLRMQFNGDVGLQSGSGLSATLSFRIPSYGIPSAVEGGKVFPFLHNILFSGKLGLDGKIIYRNNRMKSSLTSSVTNAHITLKEQGYSIEGINTTLNLLNLFEMRSAPGQQLVFTQASFGKIKLDGGHIEYQIESPLSLLIEKSSLKWCGGNILTQAFRISPGLEDYNVVLYCDRLKLATILDQMGIAQAAGSGTVNGMIPLRFKDGELSFDDAFLFSTPGGGGIIRLTNADLLTAGIPPATPQFAQVELAREALKDFTYDWVKLNLFTEGENLLLRVQFDGKPARPLPFVYKQELDSFVKVEAGSPGSRFQEIRLDLNFSLPLNKILYYGKGIQLFKYTPHKE